MNNLRTAFDRLNSQQRILLAVGGIVAAILLLLLVQCTQGSPGGSPRPSGSGRPTAATRTDGSTARPSDGSTDQPTGAPTPPATPTVPPITPPPDFDQPTAELFMHIPNAIRSTCQTGPFLEPVLTTLYCTTDDGEIAIQYATYPDAESMNAAYGASVALTEFDPGSGRCYVQADDGTITAALGRWPAEQPYSVEGQAVGRYLCFESGQPSMDYTSFLDITFDYLRHGF